MEPDPTDHDLRVSAQHYRPQKQGQRLWLHPGDGESESQALAMASGQLSGIR